MTGSTGKLPAMTYGEGTTWHDGDGATVGATLAFDSALTLKSFDVVGMYASNNNNGDCTSIRLVVDDSSGNNIWSWTGSLSYTSWNSWLTLYPNVAGATSMRIASYPSVCYPSFDNFKRVC